MQIRHLGSETERRKHSKASVYGEGEQNVQMEILMHKIKALEAKLVQETTISETLRFHNEELDRQVISKNDQINKLKQDNSFLRNKITDLQRQVQARKRSSQQMIQQIRHQNMVVKEKNIKMCQIVHFLEAQINQLREKNMGNDVVEQGLRKRVQQLTIENENIRKKMAKSQVDSQKFKLKALEGQKYWSSKLQKAKNKENEAFIQKRCSIEAKHKQELVILKSDILRYEKMLKIKDQQIGNLQRKIDQLIIQKA